MRVRQIGGAWFWIEASGGGAQRLVRAARGSEEEVASAQQITGFDAAPGMIVWTQRQGRVWSVCMRLSSGSVTTLAHSGGRIGSPCIWNGRVFWPETEPGPDPASALPALQSTVRIMASNGIAHAVMMASILAPEADLAGCDGSSLYAVVTEGTGIRTMALYAVPLNGGAAYRAAGVAAIYSAVALPGQGVAWLEPSRECSDPSLASEVHGWKPSGSATTLAVWLPSPGRLYFERGRLWMVDATASPKVWPADRGLQLVQPVALPPDMEAVAVGADGVLARRAAPHKGGEDLFLAPF